MSGFQIGLEVRKIWTLMWLLIVLRENINNSDTGQSKVL
jgi:hypothetical protein